MFLILLLSVLLFVDGLGPVLLKEDEALFHERLSNGEMKQYVLRDLISGKYFQNDKLSIQSPVITGLRGYSLLSILHGSSYSLPGQVYELKVSYPASEPFDFTISFSSSSHTEELPQRKLLDIEKEEFTPTSDTVFVNVSYTR